MPSHRTSLGLPATPRTYRSPEQPTDLKPMRKADGSIEHPTQRAPTDIAHEAARSYSAFLESRAWLLERGVLTD